MSIVRSYTNAFEVVDYTQELNIIPNSWTILGDTGLFSEEMLSTHTVTFEQTDKSLGLIGDAYRGSKPQANKDDLRKIHAYSIPHFPDYDKILPQDIQSKRAYGQQNVAETEAAVMARKMERIRKNFDVTLEVARFSTLTTGNSYAPNGTINGNFFTQTGTTQTVVDFVLGTTTTDVISKVEAVISAMQDNAQTGDIISGVTAYCSPAFFAKFINHAKIQAAYTYYAATAGQNILRERAGGAPNVSGLYRRFEYGGITFIEIRTVLAGQALIPSGDVVFVPNGTTESFVTYYGPANKMDLVNTMAERAYLFSYRAPNGESIDLDAESNFLNVLRRPQLVIRGFSSN